MRSAAPASSCALALLLVLAAPEARAEEIPEVFTSVRAIGMGDAFTAVANDESAVWTNPAGIARSRKARSRSTFNLTKVPNIIVGMNSESRTFQSNYASASKNVEGFVEKADNLSDKPFWARSAIFPVTIFDVGDDTPMAFGLYSNTTLKALIPKDTPDTTNVQAVSDAGGVITIGSTSFQNRFNVGLSLRPGARYAYEDRIPSNALLKTKKTASTTDDDGNEVAPTGDNRTIQDRLKQDANKSQGLGVDFGLMYTVADFWYPTVGFSVLNLPTGCHDNYLNPFTEKRETVCGNVYHGSFANEDALSTVDPTDVRVGVSITPRLTQKVAMRVALDAHHLPIATSTQSYGLTGIEASKLIHAGIELFVGNPLTVSPFTLRTGYSQGFMTAGAGVNLGFVDLEFATYGVDVSSSATPIEDRRYLGSLSFDF